MWGEFAFGEGYFGGTTGQFEIGFLTAAMNVYPALVGTIAIAWVLEGSIELSNALEPGAMNFSPAMETSLEIYPAVEGSLEAKPE